MEFLRLRATVLRCCLLSGLVLYIALYNWLYAHWLAPTFGYMGLIYHAPLWPMLELGWILALLPGFWMPLRLTRPSQVTLWFLYLIVYIPSQFNPIYMALQARFDLVTLMLCLFCGLSILSLNNMIPPIPLTQNWVSRGLFWSTIVAVTILLDVWVVAIFHSHMRLVGFNDIYDLRFSADEISAGTGVNYAIMLLSSVINPLYMAYGLICRRKMLIVVGFLNQLLLYSAGGSKAVILSSFILIGLYLVIGRSGAMFGLRLVSVVCALLLLLCVWATQKDVSLVVQFAMSILFMRTFATGGYTTGAYSNFFHSHPLTYLSSVHGIDAFIHYPYMRSLGLEMGQYEMGLPDLDLNAHFWASDGIAGFGPFGIIYISVLCAVVFWVLDCAAVKHDRVFTALLVGFVTLNLANVSLFTTLVSGGLGLLILLVFAMPATVRQTDSRPGNTRLTG